MEPLRQVHAAFVDDMRAFVQLCTMARIVAVPGAPDGGGRPILLGISAWARDAPASLVERWDSVGALGRAAADLGHMHVHDVPVGVWQHDGGARAAPPAGHTERERPGAWHSWSVRRPKTRSQIERRATFDVSIRRMFSDILLNEDCQQQKVSVVHLP